MIERWLLKTDFIWLDTASPAFNPDDNCLPEPHVAGDSWYQNDPAGLLIRLRGEEWSVWDEHDDDDAKSDGTGLVNLKILLGAS